MNLLAPLLGLVASWLLVAALLPLLRRGWLDPVTPRSSHLIPTPRGGGLAFVLVGSVALLASGVAHLRWLALAVWPLALVGWLDDRRGLPPSWRYGVQLLTAAALLPLATWLLPVWSGSLVLVPLLLVAITALINFTNFMDGLDGLVASCCALQLLVASQALAAPAFATLAAGLLGFLLWNWSPARVFMGDVGSTWLGAVLAGAALLAPTPVEGAGVLLAGFPLLADAASCVVRRAWAGQPLTQAHRLHLYQRLQQAGWSHGRVALLYAGATAACGGAWLGGGLLAAGAMAGVALLAGLWLDRHVAVAFVRESRSR